MGLAFAERQILLLSASTAARRSAKCDQARHLMDDMNWLRLTETLRERGLLPLLGPRILELAGARASDDFVASVKHAVDAGRKHGVLLQLVSLRIAEMLADEQICSYPLKGPLLGEAIYGDPGRRPSSDIDLLVSPKHLSRAVNVVRRLGYSAPTDYVEHCGLPRLHFALIHERGELPPVELHWRVHYYERSFAHERLLPPTPSSLEEWRPAPADELVALLLFYARDGFINLRLATDLGAWWDEYGAQLPLGAVDELLRIYPGLARVVPAAVKVAEKIVGLPAAQIIREMPKLGLRDRIAVRLANPNPHTSQSQLYADKGLIDGLLSPPGGFGAFIRRQVLPPRKVLDEHARHASRQKARSPLGRSVGMLARYTLTLTRLMRTPERLP